MEGNLNIPADLYVDLDGTFTKSDMLFESFLISIKANPLIVFLCLIWLLKGKSFLKFKLAQRANIAVALLPLNPEFYDFLQQEKAKNRKIILATASNEKYARCVYDNFEVFDSFISSDESTNLRSGKKLEKIQSLSENFSYAGNASEDFVIFEQAVDSYLVNPTKQASRLALTSPATREFDLDSNRLKLWFRQLRVHQWLKNLLLLVPLFVSKSFTSIDAISISILGLFSFSFLASATYIINDLLDLDADRSHARKKHRPLAAGNISIMAGLQAAVVLLLLALIMAYVIDGLFIFVLLSYLVLTLAYSFKLKQFIGLDVIVLASLYTIRIIAGAFILNVSVSFWLLSFSMFIFLSLALIKRCAELKSFEQEQASQAKGRDYNVLDYPILANIGISAAMLSVLMFCFYVNSNVLADQYQQPTLLWLIVPALCYWVIRMWVKTHRGEMHDDPIIFSLKDKGSLVTIAFMGLIALLAQIL